MMEFNTIPILRIFDEAKAKEFYLDFLGMRLDWADRFDEDKPVYMQVSRGDFVLHLSEHYGDCSPGAKIFVYTDELENLQKELYDKKYRGCRPGLTLAPWGGSMMEIYDPFANKFLFCEQQAD